MATSYQDTTRVVPVHSKSNMLEDGNVPDAWMEDDPDLEDFTEKASGNGLFSFLDSAYKNTKEAAIGVLFTMSKKPSKSMPLAILAMVIDFLQLSSFALPQREELDYRLPSLMAMLAETLSYSRVGYQLTKAFGVPPILIVFLSLVSLEMLNVAYVGYAWIKKDFKHLWTIKVMRATISLFVGVLFIPILSVFSNVFTCSGLDEYSCTVLLPITSVVMALFLVIGIVVSLSYFDALPTSSSPFARPHSRISTLHLLVKAVYAVAFGLVKAQSSSTNLKPFWSLLVAIPATTLAALCIWYQPYFNTKVSKLRATLSLLLSWFAWCSYFQAAFGADWNELLQPLFIAGIIIVVPFAIFAVETRRYLLVFMPISACKNSFEVELKGRFYLQGYGGSYDANNRTATQARAVQVHKWYKEAMSRFPASSALCVFHAHVVMDYLATKTTMLPRKAIAHAERRGLALDLLFTVYKAKTNLEQTADTSNVMQYVRYEKYLREATQEDAKCCVQLIKFWSELGRRHPSVQSVRDLALAIGKTSAAAKAAYSSLLTLSPDSAEILRQYGTFMVDVINDSKAGNTMLNKAARMEHKEAVLGGRPKTLDDIQSGVVGMLLIHLEDGEHLDASVVAHTNVAASKIFNEDSRSLMQKGVFSLMAKPFDEALRQAFLQFVEEGEDQYFEEELETFMCARNGTCFPVTMKLKPFSSGGTRFSVYLNFIAHPEVSEETCYFLLDSSGSICAVSRSMATVVGTLPSLYDSFGTLSIHIEKFIPGFNANSHDLVEKARKKMLKFQVTEASKTSSAFVDDDLTESSPTSFEANISVQKLEFMGVQILQVFVDPSKQSGIDLSFTGQADNVGYEGSEGGFSIASSAEAERRTGKDLKATHMAGADHPSEVGTESLSSQNMVKRQAARVRRVLLEQENLAMDKELVGLSRIYLFVTLVVCIAVVEECMSWTESLHEFAVLLNILDRIGTRTSFMVSIAYGAHSIELFNQGYPGLTQQDTQVARKEIKAAAEELKHIDLELFEMSKGLPRKIRSLYDNRLTAFDYLDNGELKIDKLGLYEATLQITSSAIQATNMPTEVFVEDEPVFFTLMNNLRYDNASVLTRFLESTAAFQHYTHDSQIARVRAAEITSISIGSVILVLIGFVSWKLLGNNRKIEDTTHEVVDVFLGIEKETCLELANRYASRLGEVHRNSNYFDDKEMQNPQDRRFSIGELSESKRESVPAPAKSTKVQPATDPSKNSRASRKKVHPASKVKEKKIKHRICSARRLKILLKVGSFVVVSGAYFVSLTMFGENMSHALEAAPGIVRHSTLRKGKAREVHHAMRLWLTGTYANHSYNSPKGGTLEFEIFPEDVRERADELQEEHDKILYGSEEDGITGLFNGNFGWDTNKQLWLNTENGCFLFEEHQNVTHEDCDQFMFGLLNGGLHTALTTYMKNIKAITRNSEIAGVLASGNKTEIKKLIQRRDVVELFELEEYFIQPQLQTAVNLHTSAIKDLLSSGEAYVSGNLSAFLVLAVLIYTAIIHPLLLQLDTEVKRTRSLLLIIPEDVLENLRHVQAFMVKHFSQA